jgi:hypothetical protein
MVQEGNPCSAILVPSDRVTPPTVVNAVTRQSRQPMGRNVTVTTPGVAGCVVTVVVGRDVDVPVGLALDAPVVAGAIVVPVGSEVGGVSSSSEHAAIEATRTVVSSRVVHPRAFMIRPFLPMPASKHSAGGW